MANYVEKENVFLRIAKYLIPWKGDKPGEIIRKIVFLVAAIVLVVSLCSILSFMGGTQQDERHSEEIKQLYEQGKTQVSIQDEKQQEIIETSPEINKDFLPLLEKNEQVIGWLTIGDPDNPLISEVVMQGEDNEYYLDHNLYGEHSIRGLIFADYREPITADRTPANTILYGHNMASGEAFGRLTRYLNVRYNTDYGLDFYKANPTFTFNTLYKNSTYKIFAGIVVNTEAKDGEVFYYIRGRKFATKSEFDEYVAKLLDRTLFFTDVDVKYGDNLITLSTCLLDYGKNIDARWVLFGREVRPGESPEVDVSKAYKNPDPLYFDTHYKIYGGEWGGRKWDASRIFDYSY